MTNNVLKIHPEDDVLVALKDLSKGETIYFNGSNYTLADHVSMGGKLYARDIRAGEQARIYGATIGTARTDLISGSLFKASDLLVTERSTDRFDNWKSPSIQQFSGRRFNGYHRKDGRVGTANYWIFIPTVFCENRNLDVIREALHHELGYSLSDKLRETTRQLVERYKYGTAATVAELIEEDPAPKVRRVFKNIDGIKFLNHQGGCGGTRQDAALLGKLLAAYADHPNVAGVTVLSLGCQNLQVRDFERELELRNPVFDKPLFIFEQQRSQSEEQLITQAIRQTFLGLVEANRQERKPASLDKLVIGINGEFKNDLHTLTANAAIGNCADRLVAMNGKLLLADAAAWSLPGQHLLDRMKDTKTASKVTGLMEEKDDNAGKNLPETTGNNSEKDPSVDIVTVMIDNAATLCKGGTSAIEDVLSYAEPAVKNGLNLVAAPRGEVELLTAQAASDATLILYSTAAGSTAGNAICPTIRVGTNSPGNNSWNELDIDCGPVLNGETSIQQMGEKILNYCVDVAGGDAIPRAVQEDRDDFIPWKKGVSL